MEKNTKRQQLEEMAEKMRNMDLRVFLSKDPSESYGYFSDEKHVGYIQATENQEGFNTAICNKVPGSNGMHLIVEKDAAPVMEENINKDYLMKAFQPYPDYFTKEDREMMPFVKYNNLEDFLQRNLTGLEEVW